MQATQTRKNRQSMIRNKLKQTVDSMKGKRNKGFTLVELIVVIVILAILTGVV